MKNLSVLIFLFLISFNAFSQGTVDEEANSAVSKGYSQNVKGAHNFQYGIGYPNLQGFYYQTQSQVTSVINQFLVSEEKKGFSTPDFTIKYEYGLFKDLGIGMHLGYFYSKSPTLKIQSLGQDGGVVNQALCQILGGDFCNPTSMGSDVSGNVYKKTHSVSVAGRLVYHVPIWRLLNTNIRVSQEHDEAISRVIDSYISTIVGYSFVSSKEVGNTEDQDSEGFLNGILGSDVFSDNGTAAGVPLNFVYQVSAGVKYHISEKWGIYGEIGYGTLGILNIGATYRIIPNKVK